MDNKTATKNIRRFNTYTSSINLNCIHLRNPWISAWWSAAFPGFGHLHLGNYLKGFVLFFWEIIINELEATGIVREKIAAVPLDNRKGQPRLMDTIHRSDGNSLLDLAAVFATIFSVLGASFGFELKWGPVIWGLIGVCFGAILGFIIDVLLTKKRNYSKSKLNTEVILIIRCNEQDYDSVKKILFANLAFGVGQLKYAE